MKYNHSYTEIKEKKLKTTRRNVYPEITIHLLLVEEMWIAGHHPIIMLCG
jgi:hypothetical protein